MRVVQDCFTTDLQLFIFETFQKEKNKQMLRNIRIRNQKKQKKQKERRKIREVFILKKMSNCLHFNHVLKNVTKISHDPPSK